MQAEAGSSEARIAEAVLRKPPSAGLGEHWASRRHHDACCNATIMLRCTIYCCIARPGQCYVVTPAEALLQYCDIVPHHAFSLAPCLARFRSGGGNIVPPAATARFDPLSARMAWTCSVSSILRHSVDWISGSFSLRDSYRILIAAPRRTLYFHVLNIRKRPRSIAERGHLFYMQRRVLKRWPPVQATWKQIDTLHVAHPRFRFKALLKISIGEPRCLQNLI